ncbi:arsenate reductase (glutaredoxin) [Neisseriaceae bacterium TC5R-5]|nr:arsenate reductase (glutaredoxin) [Neisseriaceae bacterium TC5R-5]
MIRLYHNPRCSKSRAALELLQQAGAQIDIIEYLQQAPSAEELAHILTLLQLEPRALMRPKEEAYRELKLDDISLTREQLITAMVAHPELIERPIALRGRQAVLGRPPEKVLTLLTEA